MIGYIGIAVCDIGEDLSLLVPVLILRVILDMMDCWNVRVRIQRGLIFVLILTSRNTCDKNMRINQL